MALLMENYARALSTEHLTWYKYESYNARVLQGRDSSIEPLNK